MAAQFSHFHNTLVALGFALGGVGFLLWAAIHHAREARSAGKPIMQPSHLILIGLVGGAVSVGFVAIGFAWQTLWPTAPAPVVAQAVNGSSTDEVVAKARGLAPAEKTALSERLFHLSTALDASNSVDEIGQKAAAFGNRMQGGNVVDPEKIMVVLEEVEGESQTAYDNIYKIVNERYFQKIVNERYFQEFLVYAGDYQAFSGLASQAKLYRDYLGQWNNVSGRWDAALLRPAHERFVRAFNKFRSDIAASRQRLGRLRDALR